MFLVLVFKTLYDINKTPLIEIHIVFVTLNVIQGQGRKQRKYCLKCIQKYKHYFAKFWWLCMHNDISK